MRATGGDAIPREGRSGRARARPDGRTRRDARSKYARRDRRDVRERARACVLGRGARARRCAASEATIRQPGARPMPVRFRKILSHEKNIWRGSPSSLALGTRAPPRFREPPSSPWPKWTSRGYTSLRTPRLSARSSTSRCAGVARRPCPRLDVVFRRSPTPRRRFADPRPSPVSKMDFTCSERVADAHWEIRYIVDMTATRHVLEVRVPPSE